MAKIGILTFHRSINYGAFMQCYALSNRLKKELPNDNVEVIDYETVSARDGYSASWRKQFSKVSGVKERVKFTIKAFLDPMQMHRQKVLNQAFSEDYQYLPLSKDSIITNDLEEARAWLDGRYDLIIVGSDGVWETLGYPFPNIYFLKGLSCVKMSYAATLDRLYYPTTPEYKSSYMADAWLDFAYRGVRDVSTEIFLKSCHLDFCHNCDPTLILDTKSFPKGLSRIQKQLSQAGIKEDDKIIGIMGGNAMCNMLRSHLGNKYKIVSLFTKCTKADVYLGDLTPIEWAQVFSLFSVTVTNYFHGSLLSLVNSVPTIAIDLWYSKSKEHLTKIEDLYQRIHLMNHYFKGGKELFSDGKKLCQQLELFVNNPDKQDIINAVLSEQQSFYGFLNNLKQQVERINKRNGSTL